VIPVFAEASGSVICLAPMASSERLMEKGWKQLQVVFCYSGPMDPEKCEISTGRSLAFLNALHGPSAFDKGFATTL
jgi:hypothetical protein